MTESEKFRTERLVARPWQIEDLPLAMELWGDPAVTALIDSRGKLTNAQVGEKLRAEIERERSGGVQYWAAVRSPQWRVRRRSCPASNCSVCRATPRLVGSAGLFVLATR